MKRKGNQQLTERTGKSKGREKPSVRIEQDQHFQGPGKAEQSSYRENRRGGGSKETGLTQHRERDPSGPGRRWDCIRGEEDNQHIKQRSMTGSQYPTKGERRRKGIRAKAKKSLGSCSHCFKWRE